MFLLREVFRFPVEQEPKEKTGYETAKMRGIVDAAACKAIINGKSKQQKHSFPGKSIVMPFMEQNNGDQSAQNAEDRAGSTDRYHAAVKSRIKEGSERGADAAAEV